MARGPANASAFVDRGRVEVEDGVEAEELDC